MVIKLVKNYLIYFILLYQKKISRWLPVECRFYPSCSEYMKMSLEKYHVLKAIYRSSHRLCRCNQLFAGGEDLP